MKNSEISKIGKSGFLSSSWKILKSLKMENLNPENSDISNFLHVQLPAGTRPPTAFEEHRQHTGNCGQLPSVTIEAPVARCMPLNVVSRSSACLCAKASETMAFFLGELSGVSPSFHCHRWNRAQELRRSTCSCARSATGKRTTGYTSIIRANRLPSFNLHF